MALEVGGITCGYGSEDVLREVSLSVAPGERVFLAGPNGSGKSTLLRVMSRVLRPRLGSALLEGRDLYAMPARECARVIAVVAQEAVLDFEFTCHEMGSTPSIR